MPTFATGIKASTALLLVSLLSACVSYEPRVLVPALTLSPEDINLMPAAASGQLRFGLEVTLNESDSLLNVEVLPGIRVRSVSAGSAASSAGIQPGDIILSINDTPTNHPDVLGAIQQQPNAEGTYRFNVRRNTVVFETTLNATPTNTSTGPRELYRADPLATRAGYRTELVSVRGQAEVAAARVVEVFTDSPLPAAAINTGDLILALNGQNLNSAQDLISRVNQEAELGEAVVFTVYDGTSVTNKEVRLWNPGRRISRISLGPLLHYESSLNPSSSSLTILDLWLFAFYRYNRVDEEQNHSILGLIKYSSNYGELVDETE